MKPHIRHGVSLNNIISCPYWYLIKCHAKQNRLFLRVISGKNNARIWIGATYIVTEGVWLWDSTGEELEFENWAPGMPNNNRGEQYCAFIRPDETLDRS